MFVRCEKFKEVLKAGSLDLGSRTFLEKAGHFWLRPIFSCNCHNPGQPKTKSPGVVLLSVRETTPHHHTTLGMITIWTLLGNMGSSFLVCSLILNQLKEI